MLALIDNYDSFTYNLVQYLGELGADVCVFRNDAVTVEELEAMRPTHIVISPGPGTPAEAGISPEVIRKLGPRIPTLGVCLGHQAIGEVFGGKVVRAPRLMHGKTSPIRHNGDALFRGLPGVFHAARYHSLVIEPESLPADLEVTAQTDEGEIMAVRHREYPIFGLQFHPESVLTPHGKQILRNFLQGKSAVPVLDTPVTTNPVPIGAGLQVGGRDVVLMAGPCSVESYEQTRAAAEALHRAGLRVLRGGAFKPRTSPNSFQGLGVEGLEILRAVADEFGLLVITEAMAVEHIPLVARYADIIQIGSRNMQNYPLLWAAGESEKPVLLKRGFMSTVDEWLAAAEHITSRGNERIILCERGIRTFETSTRNTLDTNAIAVARQRSPFPVIGDPSHATGRADLVLPAARAALAAGADGLLVEFHPNPSQALSDGQQSLPLAVLPDFVASLRTLAASLGRGLA